MIGVKDEKCSVSISVPDHLASAASLRKIVPVVRRRPENSVAVRYLALISEANVKTSVRRMKCVWVIVDPTVVAAFHLTFQMAPVMKN